MKRALLTLASLTTLALVGCSAPPEEEAATSSTSESAFIYDAGWDVILTDGTGYGFCLRIRGGLLCGTRPVEDWNDATGTYNTRSWQTGRTHYTTQYGGDTNYFVDANGYVFSNCQVTWAGNDTQQCRYFWGHRDSMRIINTSKRRWVWVVNAAGQTVNSVQCGVAITQLDAQTMAESCFI